MASYTLDDIRAAAEKKYGSTDIDLGNGEVLSLVNPLRLSKERRKSLEKIQDKMNEKDADQQEAMEEALRIVADSGHKVDHLLREVGDDLAVLAEIFASYTGGTEAGEA